MSEFYKWSLGLRHQRYLVDKQSCFDSILRVFNHGTPNHQISNKISVKVIVRLRSDRLPPIVKKSLIDSAFK